MGGRQHPQMVYGLGLSHIFGTIWSPVVGEHQAKMDSSTAQLTELTAQLDSEREARQQLDVENSRLQAGVVSHNGFNPRMGPITWMFWGYPYFTKTIYHISYIFNYIYIYRCT